MITRCYDENHKHYTDYGGRGIGVCAHWQNSFDAFLADMGRRPSDDHTIERVDNDSSYTPENCRWATPQEQARNRRNNTLITLDNETMPLAAWSARTGLHRATISTRLRNGWSVNRTLTAPVQKKADSVWQKRP